MRVLVQIVAAAWHILAVKSVSHSLNTLEFGKLHGLNATSSSCTERILGCPLDTHCDSYCNGFQGCCRAGNECCCTEVATASPPIACCDTHSCLPGLGCLGDGCCPSSMICHTASGDVCCGGTCTAGLTGEQCEAAPACINTASPTPLYCPAFGTNLYSSSGVCMFNNTAQAFCRYTEVLAMQSYDYTGGITGGMWPSTTNPVLFDQIPNLASYSNSTSYFTTAQDPAYGNNYVHFWAQRSGFFWISIDYGKAAVDQWNDGVTPSAGYKICMAENATLLDGRSSYRCVAEFRGNSGPANVGGQTGASAMVYLTTGWQYSFTGAFGPSGGIHPAPLGQLGLTVSVTQVAS